MIQLTLKENKLFAESPDAAPWIVIFSKVFKLIMDFYNI